MVYGFKKYQHVERLERIKDSGILDGRVYVFPKLDGAMVAVIITRAVKVKKRLAQNVMVVK